MSTRARCITKGREWRKRNRFCCGSIPLFRPIWKGGQKMSCAVSTARLNICCAWRSRKENVLRRLTKQKQNQGAIKRANAGYSRNRPIESTGSARLSCSACSSGPVKLLRSRRSANKAVCGAFDKVVLRGQEKSLTIIHSARPRPVRFAKRGMTDAAWPTDSSVAPVRLPRSRRSSGSERAHS